MEFDKLIIKFIWKSKRTRTKTLLKNRKKIEVLALLDTKIYYEIIVTETKIDKWTRGTKRESQNKHTHIKTKCGTLEILGNKRHANK